MLHAVSHSHGGDETSATITLDHAGRHLRRKLVTTDQGEEVMIDLPEPILFADGDRLLLEDGRTIAIVAAEEALYEVRPGAACPLRHLAWHLGNRHLPAQIDTDRILIQRDHVIRAMLEGLGASIREIAARFQPVHGAYHAHGHAHGHSHADGHHHHDRHD